MKRLFKAVLAVVFLTLLAIAATRRPTGVNSFVQRAAEMLHDYLHPPPVTVLELQGNVEVRTVRLSFKLSERISRLLVEEGDPVTAGQLVAELEPQYLEDAVKQAEAILQARKAELLRLENGSRPEEIERARSNTQAALAALENAERLFRREQELVSGGASSPEAFDNARTARDRAAAQLAAAEAEQKLVEAGPRDEDIARAQAMVKEAEALSIQARRRLEDTHLRSPVSGVIQTRVHEAGDFVNAGEPVYVISLNRPVWVRAYVDEVYLDRIRPGMKAVVRTDGGQSFTGQIGFVSPSAEFTPKMVQTRDIRTDLVYRLRIIVQDPENVLRQGMPVSVCIDLEQTVERTGGALQVNEEPPVKGKPDLVPTPCLGAAVGAGTVTEAAQTSNTESRGEPTSSPTPVPAVRRITYTSSSTVKTL